MYASWGTDLNLLRDCCQYKQVCIRMGPISSAIGVLFLNLAHSAENCNALMCIIPICAVRAIQADTAWSWMGREVWWRFPAAFRYHSIHSHVANTSVVYLYTKSSYRAQTPNCSFCSHISVHWGTSGNCEHPAWLVWSWQIDWLSDISTKDLLRTRWIRGRPCWILLIAFWARQGCLGCQWIPLTETGLL